MMPKLLITPVNSAQPSLRSIRLNLGLNLREASERIGCCRATLSELERGHYGLSLGHAVAVAKAYHIPLETLALILYPHSGEGTWKSEPRPARAAKTNARSAEGPTASAPALSGGRADAYLTFPPFLKGI